MENDAAPLVTLRRHGSGAPWSVAELARLADHLLAAALLPMLRPTTERTVRFYVSRGVVQPPYGRGPGSTWGYPHLVELLAARLAQQGGDGLEAIAARRGSTPLATLEQEVASHFGGPLPPPTEAAAVVESKDPVPLGWWRLEVTDGVELHLRDGHPLLADSRRLGAVLDGLRSEIATSPETS